MNPLRRPWFTMTSSFGPIRFHLALPRGALCLLFACWVNSLLLFLPLQAAALPYDLETAAQDLVLETKKIEVPGYPHAFNPSLVRWQGRLLMSFRHIPDPKYPFNSEIGLIFLNEDFSPSGQPQLLNLRDENSCVPCRAEDARLILAGGHLLIVYDDNTEPKISRGGFRIYIAEIYDIGDHFIAGTIECMSRFPGASNSIREKSWVPFIYHDQLLLAYSLVPHLIFSPRLDGSCTCDIVDSTVNPISWPWGTLRGGTPALLQDEGYLAFFHSSIEMASQHSDGKEISHYFIGAYLFSPNPPFTIAKISPEPIIGKNFYNGPRYKPYWKTIRCVFPCGYISDENFIWLSYGRDDHEAWIAKLDKKKLMQSLLDCHQ